MLQRMVAILSLCAALSGCTLNSARQIEQRLRGLPTERAVIVFGVSEEFFPDLHPSRPVLMILDHFSLTPPMGITGDCFRYDRLEVETPVRHGSVTYVAFSAPPGDYVVSPFLVARREESVMNAFRAPVARATYLGDFVVVNRRSEQWEREIERRDSLANAQAFADRLGLGELSQASATPIEGFGPIFVCTP